MLRGKIKLESNENFNVVLGAYYTEQEHENFLHPSTLRRSHHLVLAHCRLPINLRFEMIFRPSLNLSKRVQRDFITRYRAFKSAVNYVYENFQMMANPIPWDCDKLRQ